MKKQSYIAAVTMTVPSGGATHSSSISRVLTKVLALFLLGCAPLIREANADVQQGYAHLVEKTNSPRTARINYLRPPTVRCNCPGQQFKGEGAAHFPGIGDLFVMPAPRDLLTAAACPDVVKIEALLDKNTLFVGTLVRKSDARYHGLLTKQFGPAKYQYIQLWDIHFTEINYCA